MTGRASQNYGRSRRVLLALGILFSASGCFRTADPGLVDTLPAGLAGGEDSPLTPVRPVVVQGTVVPDAVPYEPQIPLRDTPKVRRYFHGFRDRNRSFIAEALPRYAEYIPLIDRILRQHGLPIELACVALIESRFQPAARSPMGAVGLWQFMARTARNFGLRVSVFRDDRKDVERSTVAAAKYLSELYGQFGDWFFVLAAYNSGPARIASLRRNHPTLDFFELDERGLLPKETSNFVHKVIAAILIFRRLDEYGFITEDSPTAEPRTSSPALDSRTSIQ